MPDFFPPRPNPLLIRLGHALVPLWLPWRRQITLELVNNSLDLTALNHERVLLMPNHPTFDDPLVVFWLSGRLKQSFYYLASSEQFTGLLGPTLQGVGGYSIRRGVADRPSIAQSLDLLAQPGCRLVIFPEGGCSFQNDTVTPFRVGAVQLAFQALNKLSKQAALPDLYVVPISIKYRYTRDMTRVIRASLSRLEQALGISAASDDYDRLRAVADRLLSTLEQEYGVPTQDGETWDDRIHTLRLHVLHQCEQQLSLPSVVQDPLRERVYRLYHTLQTQPDALNHSDWTPDFMQKTLMRLLNFDAIYDGYVAANPTPERFLDTLTRFERTVFNIDRPAPKGPRTAKIWIGAPLNLTEQFEAYHQHRSSTVSRITAEIQQAVQANLDRL